MGSLTEKLSAEVQPPRRGQIVALEVTTTARAYSLASLNLAGVTPDEAGSRRDLVWLTLQAETAAVYFQISDGADTDLDETTVVAESGTLGFSNDYGARIPADDERSFVIDRSRDNHLIVKGAGAATLRFWVSSGPG